ncbi:hypothetical protein EON79_11175 [bacterium]|nr:MAG: hypothetical protein EON79_11175 [bacterium]
MAALLLSGMVLQAGAPTILPPYAEPNAPLVNSGPPSGTGFAPSQGGFMLTLGGTPGPSHGIFTNAATLGLLYLPDADIVGRSDVGTEIAFRRSFRTDLASAKIHSPGMPDGWTHNLDVIMSPATDKAQWRGLRLRWPNGAVEDVLPLIDAKGQPTGEFQHGPGQPFLITGEVGAGLNEWKSITMLWRTGGIWRFEPHASGPMVLREIGERTSPTLSLRMGYDPERHLAEVTRPPEKVPVMRFGYQDGRLASVTEAIGGSYRTFTYAPLKDGKETVLWKVSGLTGRDKTPVDRFAYSYTKSAGVPFLSSIAIPSPAGGAEWATAKIEYKEGRVAAMVDANGNRTELTQE